MTTNDLKVAKNGAVLSTMLDFGKELNSIKFDLERKGRNILEKLVTACGGILEFNEPLYVDSDTKIHYVKTHTDKDGDDEFTILLYGITDDESEKIHEERLYMLNNFTELDILTYINEEYEENN